MKSTKAEEASTQAVSPELITLGSGRNPVVSAYALATHAMVTTIIAIVIFPILASLCFQSITSFPLLMHAGVVSAQF
jgi:hypothetical protein